MKLSRERFHIALGAGELLRLETSRGVEVVCEAGLLWITEESRARDLWLRAGERVFLQGRGITLLEADRPARVRVADAGVP